jgi:hypothetical protein
MANFINNYFSTPVPQMKVHFIMCKKPLNLFLMYLNILFQNINMALVTNKEIKDTVKLLKWKSSHGYDEIQQNLLEINLPFILSLLTYMCNKLLSLGIFSK